MPTFGGWACAIWSTQILGLQDSATQRIASCIALARPLRLRLPFTMHIRNFEVQLCFVAAVCAESHCACLRLPTQTHVQALALAIYQRDKVMRHACAAALQGLFCGGAPSCLQTTLFTSAQLAGITGLHTTRSPAAVAAHPRHQPLAGPFASKCAAAL
jgi:hypothetical protein